MAPTWSGARVPDPDRQKAALGMAGSPSLAMGYGGIEWWVSLGLQNKSKCYTLILVALS